MEALKSEICKTGLQAGRKGNRDAELGRTFWEREMIRSHRLRLEAGQPLPGTEGEGLEFSERRKQIGWRPHSEVGTLTVLSL